MFKLLKFTNMNLMKMMIKILNELTRVEPQESHPPGVVGAAHPGIGHNSDKDWIETAVHHFWFHINPFHSAQSQLG